ncbi:type II secretion system F family protein [Desulforhopalus sp. IMCC35007]|uniref:type II secretion system F family protein n=1 Tax=Desulforhopalus sp. IMCC35007 TaxID=2569543 RepID=UPI0010AE43E4|nr:type II secretion system F family protein [Desulforhopalus sp. IMCC35007]TKB08227.1 type II secretion system F family protein [Desulforhopalus sp. IMCC35007]
MPHFSYQTMDSAGEVTRNQGKFSSLEDLFGTVERKGEILVDYRKKLFPPLPRPGRALKRPILAEFFRNLALLIQGGVPLREALDDMTKPPCHPVLGDTFNAINKRIDDGLLFSEALREAPPIIPKIMLPLISIGEETGNLDRTLRDGANHIDRVDYIISSTRRALIYPIVVLLAMFGALAFWMLFVLPQLMDLFASMGIEDLPLPTRILIATTDFFDRWWPVIPLFISIFVIFYLLTKRNPKIQYIWDQMWNHVPLIKNVIRASQLAFFFEYTAMLTDAGVNILRSMELMEQSVSNQILKNGVRLMRKEISEGNPMSEAIKSFAFFEPFVLRMVRVGEQTGNMPEQFALLASHYMKQVDKLVSAMSKTIEPLIIVVAGFIFAIIAMGLLGPVYNMISQLG